jgi:hypothetical protein
MVESCWSTAGHITNQTAKSVFEKQCTEYMWQDVGQQENSKIF